MTSLVMDRRALGACRWLILLVALLAAAPLPAAHLTPLDVVQRTTDDVLTILHAEREIIKKEPERIYGIIEDQIVPHIDFDLMSRWVLGMHWRQATPAQRQRFALEFRRLVVRTYATALLEYTNETIEYPPVRDAAGAKDIVVKTVIRQPGGPSIPVDYSLYLGDAGEWKVYDLTIDRVSMITNYRSSFGSQVSRGGLQALIDELARHNKKSESK